MSELPFYPIARFADHVRANFKFEDALLFDPRGPHLMWFRPAYTLQKFYPVRAANDE